MYPFYSYKQICETIAHGPDIVAAVEAIQCADLLRHMSAAALELSFHRDDSTQTVSQPDGDSAYRYKIRPWQMPVLYNGNRTSSVIFSARTLLEKRKFGVVQLGGF
jgi:hypothetical protein